METGRPKEIADLCQRVFADAELAEPAVCGRGGVRPAVIRPGNQLEGFGAILPAIVPALASAAATHVPPCPGRALRRTKDHRGRSPEPRIRTPDAA